MHQGELYLNFLGAKVRPGGETQMELSRGNSAGTENEIYLSLSPSFKNSENSNLYSRGDAVCALNSPLHSESNHRS